ncbi:MAG: TlpA family protein disulfide reductase [Deltaproteobacteria bacterium]|nr:TlpA family protein disulfide reductase [Deltaproteobacteria bacterium]MDH3382644.1 TlpA family protein disulfide reductase [Deltaproteobacteria bacterium]
MRSAGSILAFLALFVLTTMMPAARPTAYAGDAPASAASTGVTEWIDFTLPDANGKDVSLSRIIGKKPVLLAFWATWCPPCHKAVPILNRMHRESPAISGIQILALDFMESEKKVNAFIASKKVAYPVLLDRRGRVARKYKVVGIPTYVLIGRDGTVVYRDHELPEIQKYLK